MKRIVKVAVAVGTVSVINLLAGFARAKCGALLLGPDGVGRLAQANGFLVLATNVCSLGLGAGIQKRLSEALAAEDRRRVEELLDTCFQLFCLVAGGTTLLLLPLLAPAASLLMGDTRLAWPFLGVVLALPLSVIAASFCEVVLYGAQRYDLYARACLTSALLGLVPFLLMTALWGLPGTLASVGVAALTRVALLLHAAMAAVRWRPRFPRVFAGAVLRSLAAYGAVMLLQGALSDGSALVIRTAIVKRLGAAANGIYQVPVALSSYYTVFLANALWGHLYSELSRPMAREERAAELNAALRFTILGISSLGALLLAARMPVILFCYSHAFQGAEQLLPWYVLGDLFFMMATALGISLLAIPRLKAYVAVWAGFFLLRTALSVLLLDRWGLIGPPLAYAASAVAAFLVCAVYHARQLAIPVTPSNLWLLPAAVGVVALPALLPLGPGGRLACVTLLIAVWLFSVLTPEERRSVGSFLPDRSGGSRRARRARPSRASGWRESEW